MTNDFPQGPAEWYALHPYASLTPDAVLDALADIGLMGDGRLIALSSYENRVYQIQLETERAPAQTDGTPVPESVVAKFYRPGRWTDAQIQEEHDFAAELVVAEAVIPSPHQKTPPHLGPQVWRVLLTTIAMAVPITPSVTCMRVT